MRGRRLVAAISVALCAVAVALVAAVGASADTAICGPGTGAGDCSSSEGVGSGPLELAIDEQTGRLYVVDNANNRIDVFGPTGSFEMAFGWGVQDGAAEPQICTTFCRQGLAGPGGGQFDEPLSIAVDNSCAWHDPPLTESTVPKCSEFNPSAHDVYVSDKKSVVYETQSARVEKFDPEGNFLLEFGEPGEGPGQFVSPLNGGINVGVGPSGTVYVVDSPRPESAPTYYRLQQFSPDGTLVAGPVTLPGGDGAALGAMAVDPGGSFYVSNLGGPLDDGVVRKYAEDGTAEGAVAEERVNAMSVDSAGNLFTASNSEDSKFSGMGKEIAEFDAAGNPVRKFGYGSLLAIGQSAGIAPFHSATGDVYVSDGLQVLHIPYPNPGPVVVPERCLVPDEGRGNSTAKMVAEINPEGQATSYHYELVTEAQFQQDVEELGPGHGFDHATRVPADQASDPSLAAGFNLQEAPLVAEVTPETAYRCRVIAENAAGEATGQEGEFESKELFEFGPIFAANVGTSSALLQAEGNPLGILSTGRFEYVDDASFQQSGFASAKLAPADPFSFGEGTAMVPREAEITGLTPNTVYHFRLRVEDRFVPGGITCPRRAATCPEHEPTFRTLAAQFPGLPDGRAWELVSPSEKNGAEVAVPRPAGGLILGNERVPRIQAAAETGEAATYTSWTSFGQAAGAPGVSQYLSKRTAQGWVTENISPAGRQAEATNPAFRGFSPDLRFAALVNFELPLTADAQPGFQNMYLRDNASGSLMALTKEPITFTPVAGNPVLRQFCSTYAGIAAGGGRAFFSGNGAMGGAPSGEGISLYEWSSGAPLKLVSVLPNGTPAPPAERTHFGSETAFCWMAQGVIRHAVSSDGSKVFWTYGGTFEGSQEPLFARINGTETVQLDAKAGGAGPSGNGHFWAATADGSKAFFTAPGRLTKKAHAPGQLYVYDTVTRTTTDLTPGSIAPEIDGVIGASEDGGTVYFVGSGALTGTQQNSAGQEAESGAHNLYSWREGEGLRFIAILSSLDETDWGVPAALTASLTPDGRHLAFQSTETTALSGYDNLKFPAGSCEEFEGGVQPKGDQHCSEVYLYDAETQDLTCVSCNPSGARPSGGSSVPAWTNPFAGPRYLSADGSRLFFMSWDPLVASDQDGMRDVYEFERIGSHSCVGGSSAFVPAIGGCLFLISSGRSSDQSYFVDASADGRDVFFSTRERLVGWDGNGDFDLYDAREGGGFPEPPPVSQPCEGESCKPPSPSSPAATSPGTRSFEGPGNPKQAKKPACGKRRHAVKKHGKWRCVKKPRHKKAHRHHRRHKHKGHGARGHKQKGHKGRAHKHKGANGDKRSAGHHGRAGR